MSALRGQIFEKQDQAMLKKMNVKRREEIFSQLTGEDAVPFDKVELESSSNILPSMWFLIWN